MRRVPGGLLRFDRVGTDVEHQFRVARVVGLHMDFEVMLAAHARVHGVRELERGALARVNDRSTYGDCRRSASFQGLNLEIAQLEGAFALVLDGELLDHGLAHIGHDGNVAEVDLVLGNHRLRASGAAAAAGHGQDGARHQHSEHKALYDNLLLSRKCFTRFTLSMSCGGSVEDGSEPTQGKVGVLCRA